MRTREIAGSLAWMAFGVVFTVSALKQGLMMKGMPGPGFLPFLCGLALTGLGFFVLVPSLLRHSEAEADSADGGQPGGWKRVLAATALLVGFGIALEILGFALATFLFILAATRIMASPRWWVSLLTAAATSAASYLLFVVLLGVSLPTGPLGFI